VFGVISAYFNIRNNLPKSGTFLLGHPVYKPPRRPVPRWMDNIKMVLVEISWCGVDWTGLAPDRDKWRALV
jgi:hypothetical protein